jgi:hypothetical protein
MHDGFIPECFQMEAVILDQELAGVAGNCGRSFNVQIMGLIVVNSKTEIVGLRIPLRIRPTAVSAAPNDWLYSTQRTVGRFIPRREPVINKLHIARDTGATLISSVAVLALVAILAFQGYRQPIR